MRQLRPRAGDDLGNASFAAAAVLVLLAAGLSTALMAPDPRDRGGGLGLDGALAALHDVVARALDLATGDAVEACAREEGCDLSSCLDASVRARLSPSFPMDIEGWTAQLEDARGELVPTAGPRREVDDGTSITCAEARAILALRRAGAQDPVRVEVAAAGSPAALSAGTARASASLGALADPCGPLAYSVRAELWQLLQGRALSGVTDPALLFAPGEVRSALERALGALSGGGQVPAPSPPPIELGALVRQSVAGGLEASVGCLDDYLGLDGGLAGLLLASGVEAPAGLLATTAGLEAAEEAVKRAASAALEGLAMGALEGALGELPPVPCDAGLTDSVARGVEYIDDLSARLEVRTADGTSAALEVARAAIHGLVASLGPRDGAGPVIEAFLGALERAAVSGGWPLDAIASRAATALSSCALATAGFALLSARDALLALGTTGMEVPGGPANGTVVTSSPGLAIECHLASFSCDGSWTGETACAPGPLVRDLVDAVSQCRPVTPPPLGALPYVSVLHAALAGEVELSARMAGATGPGAVVCIWRQRLDLPVEVTVVTGWPIEGVVYAPTRTLGGDIAAVARAVYDAAAAGAGWLAGRVRDAGEWVAAQLRGLARDLVKNVLAEPAYNLSRSLFRIGESLLRRHLDDALNESWSLLSHLLGSDMRDRLTWSFHVLGLDARVYLDLFKQQLGVTVERGAVNVTIVLRRLCDPNPPWRPRPIDGYHWGVFGQACLRTGGARAVVDLDPLTLEHASVLTARLGWGDDGRGGPSKELVVEALSASQPPKEVGVRLSQLLGGLPLMSVGGALGGVDAGVVLRSAAATEKDMGDLALRAFKRAWLESVKGWRTGELVGALRSPPDAGLFFETLLRELYFALLDGGRGAAVELEAFVEVDPPGAGMPKVHVGFVVTDPLDVLLPLMCWARAAVARLAGAGSATALDGAGAGLASAVAEHVLLRLELSWGVSLPDMISTPGSASPPEVGLVVRAEANLAALRAAAGGARGGWEASLTVMLRGVPGAALAVVPGMGSTHWRWADVTLVRVRLHDASAPRVLISQVLYDPRGRDSDLEFVELLNAGDRVVDAGGLVLEDDAGSFVVPAHRPLLPGAHLLIGRNRTAVRSAWGVDPDAWGMGLRLNNGGDAVALLSPDGRVLDEVSWDGFVPGWERVSVREGESLARLAGDLRVGEPGAWCASEPSPRRGGGL